MTTALFMLLLSFRLWSTECIQVEGDYVRAGDVPQAAHLAPAEILMRAPIAGARRTLETLELRRVLRLGEDSPPLPPVCFEQASESLTVARIVEAMRSAFSGLEVSVRVTDYSLYAVPRGRLEFPRSGLMATSATRPGQRVMWRGKVTGAARRSTPVWARVHLEIARDVLSVRRSLSSGERIQKDDLVLESRIVFPLDHGPTMRVEEVAGMLARRRLAAGIEVTRAMLVEPYEVEPRQTIDLVVQSDGVRLRLPVVAEGRARTGEFVWLQQTATGKRLRGRVTGHGQAVLEIEAKNGDKTDDEARDEMHSRNGVDAGRQ